MNAELPQKFQTTDGFELAYRHWEAAKTKRAVVCIHGIGDYSGWFRNIAPSLAANGSEVYALDLRGFGESPEEGSPRGFVNDFGRHLQDIDDFVVYIRSCHKTRNLHMLGHSLGCVYSIWHAANHPQAVDSLVLAAPAVVSTLHGSKKPVKSRFGKISASKEPHNLYFSLEARDRDPEEIKIMLADPLETWQLTSSYLSSIKKVLFKNLWKNVSLLKAPTLILQGGADTTAKPLGAKRLQSKLGSIDKKLMIFPDAGHWLFDAFSPAPPREKCDSEKREQTIVAIIEWLKKH